MTIVIKDASVLTLDPADRLIEKADIVVDGGRIVALGQGAAAGLAEPPDRVIEADGLLAMPGLINGHFHSASAFMKGVFEGAPLELYMLYETPGDDFATSARVAYLRTMLAALELLKQGVTAVRDDQHFFLPATDEAVDMTFQAFADAGMRASVGLADPNVPIYAALPYIKDLLPAPVLQQLQDQPLNSEREVLDLYERAFARWHGRDDDRLRLHVSCSAPQRVTPELMRGLSELAVARDVAFDMHILETKMQRVHGRADYGKSLVAYVDDLGALNEQSVVIHAVWTDEEDLARMARAGAAVAHNPVSNLKLGSGVMSMRKMLDHGIPVCLGTDEASVDDASNLWVTAKVGALLQTLDQPNCDLWPTADDYLRSICHGGARALRQAGQLGMLAEGCYADLILLDLDSLPFVPLNNLKRQLVYGETGSSVVMTMVAGRVVCENGRVLSVDEAAIKEEIRALWPRYRALCDAFNRQNEPVIVPATREVYDRCAREDVGFTRWIGG